MLAMYIRSKIPDSARRKYCLINLFAGKNKKGSDKLDATKCPRKTVRQVQ